MAKIFGGNCLISISGAPDHTKASGRPVCKTDNTIAHQLYNRLFTGLIVSDRILHVDWCRYIPYNESFHDTRCHGNR